MDEYYYLDNSNQAIGPVSKQDLTNKFANREITKDTLYAKSGDADWLPITHLFLKEQTQQTDGFHAIVKKISDSECEILSDGAEATRYVIEAFTRHGEVIEINDIRNYVVGKIKIRDSRTNGGLYKFPVKVRVAIQELAPTHTKIIIQSPADRVTQRIVNALCNLNNPEYTENEKFSCLGCLLYFIIFSTIMFLVKNI